MKIKVKNLKNQINEIAKSIISPSPSYLAKEGIKDEIQQLILKKIKNGEIETQDDLEKIFDNIKLSLTALKMIPISIWKKL